MQMSSEKLGTFASLISGCSFATLAIFAKFAYQGGANVPSVLFMRFTGAALVFWLYFLFKSEKINYGRTTVLKLMLMGSLGYGSMSAFFLLAVSRIPASLAAMLLYLYPALVTVTSVILKHERYNLQKGVALVITFAGTVMVLGTSFESSDFFGIMCGIGAACVYTAYIVAGSQVLKPLEPIRATTYIMTGAAAAYILFGLFSRTLVFSYNSYTWMAIGGVIFIATVLAVTTFWMGVKWVGPSKTSIISTVEPLFTVFLAAVIFNEMMTITQLIGGTLILAGVVILQYPLDKHAKHRKTA